MKSGETLLPMLIMGGQKSWVNPQLSSLNKLPAHAAFFPFKKDQDPARESWRESGWVVSLNGKWDFQILEKPEQATPAVLEKQKWAKIQVPGNWTMQGFGKPHYTNVQMPFPEAPPNVPAENPTGIYRTTFKVPASWKNRRVVLHFAGCEGALFVYVNGQPVGLSKDARTPAEFDISKYVKSGANTLVCVVTRWSDASFIEDQDHWWQSGLQRDVILYSTANPFVEDIHASAELAEDFKSADFQVKVQIGYPGEVFSNQYKVQVRLLDPQGKDVFNEPLELPCKPATPPRRNAPNERTTLTFTQKVEKPQLWSHETPALYTVLVRLVGPKVDEPTGVRFGFRKIEIRDRKLLINGQMVRINGVNYHDHHDTLGKYIPQETYETDLRLMKQFNVNAVRTAHYPKDSVWYDLCDQYGMYLVDEANIESHAFYDDCCRDPRYTNAFVERVRGMVERDKNHPSIIFWSLGNESGYGANHDAAAAYARRVDPSRPLHYEGAIVDFAGAGRDSGLKVSDVICPMYPQIETIIAWAKLKHGERPLIMCEYSHTMGNSNGSLSDYYAAFDKYPGLQGGYLWEWIDHGIKHVSPDGKPYWLYGGDFGDKPHDANFVTDGIVWPDRTAHPALYEFKYLAAPVRVEGVNLSKGIVRIVSWRYFTRLDAGLLGLEGEWELVVDGEKVQEGKLPALKIAPGEALEVDLGIKPYGSGEAFLNFYFYQKEDTWWAPKGHEVGWQQLALPVRKAKAPAAKPAETVRESTQLFVLTGGGTRAEFNKKTGEMIWLGKSENLLAFGPELNVWRGAVDNDGIKLLLRPGSTLQRWLDQGFDQIKTKFDSIKIVDGNALEIVHQASGRKQWDDFKLVQRYAIHADGILQADYRIEVGNDLTDIPRAGVMLGLRKELEELTWYGRGPWENYCDRKASAMVGRYGGTVSEQYVPYIMPQESGHKTDVRWMRLSGTGSDGKPIGLIVCAPEGFEFTASHSTPQDLYACKHTIDLKPRPEVILELDAAMRGLGTASCGPDTLMQYRLLEKEYRLSLQIKPE